VGRAGGRGPGAQGARRGRALNAEATVRRLGLQPHPEGGFYRETFRSPISLHLPDGRVRPASTAILYLLPAGDRSGWHRVISDEVWHHYEGGTLLLYRLGMPPVRLSRAEPQAVVPAGVWQAAEPEGEAVLVGCTVAPGFDFADFTMGDAAELEQEFPEDSKTIRRLGR
jgi:predicted cupin superfamily sugar epimerase